MQFCGVGWQLPSPSALKAGSATKNIAVFPPFTPMKETIGLLPSGRRSSSLTLL